MINASLGSATRHIDLKMAKITMNAATSAPPMNSTMVIACLPSGPQRYMGVTTTVLGG